jgi:DNA-directed RNA polymerase beta subunit
MKTEFEEYNIVYQFDFSKINISKGTYMNKMGKVKYLTPNKARLKGETYYGNVYTNITQTTWYETKEGLKILDKPTIKYRHNNILLCKIPIMVGSKFCIKNYNENFNISNEEWWLFYNKWSRKSSCMSRKNV